VPGRAHHVVSVAEYAVDVLMAGMLRGRSDEVPSLTDYLRFKNHPKIGSIDRDDGAYKRVEGRSQRSIRWRQQDFRLRAVIGALRGARSRQSSREYPKYEKRQSIDRSR